MASRFASLTKQDIEKLVEDKDHFFFRWIFNKTIIGWGICDIQNNQGRGGGYQPKPKAEVEYPYWDLDCSGDLDYSGYQNYYFVED